MACEELWRQVMSSVMFFLSLLALLWTLTFMVRRLWAPRSLNASVVVAIGPRRLGFVTASRLSTLWRAGVLLPLTVLRSLFLSARPFAILRLSTALFLNLQLGIHRLRRGRRCRHRGAAMATPSPEGNRLSISRARFLSLRWHLA